MELRGFLPSISIYQNISRYKRKFWNVIVWKYSGVSGIPANLLRYKLDIDLWVQDWQICISGFLFGYEDELACITESAPITKETVTDDDQEDDDWDDDDDWNDDWTDENDEFQRLKRDIPSYRDSSGKCLWGILRDLNNTEHETIR